MLPFFLRFGDYFDRNYNAEEILRRDNCLEWSERFCSKARWEEVAGVIYEADEFEIAQLHRAAADPTRKTTLPYRLEDNNFAYVVAYNGCVEVTRYLTFAKKMRAARGGPGRQMDGCPARRGRHADPDRGGQTALLRHRISFRCGCAMPTRSSDWRIMRALGK
jgi:hypothetical protein